MSAKIESIYLTLNRPDFPFTIIKPENLDFNKWSTEVENEVDLEKFTRLWGGYSNYVVKPNGTNQVWVYWREEHRWQDILRDVVLESTISAKFGISGRTLLDKSKPLEIVKGRLVSKLNYVIGDVVYPWEDPQIIIAAQTQSRLNKVLRTVSFDPNQSKPSSPRYQLIHADFNRANVLFRGKNKPAVIDYERASYGSLERDMGKTLSYILIDTQIAKEKPDTRGKNIRQLEERFEARKNLYFASYDDHFDRQEVVINAINFLRYDDYGSLNYVRDFALNWLGNIL